MTRNGPALFIQNLLMLLNKGLRVKVLNIRVR